MTGSRSPSPRCCARGSSRAARRCCWSATTTSLTYAEADAPLGGARARSAAPRARARARTSGCSTPTAATFVVAWLAAARIGAVTVPLSTFSTSAELARPAAQRRRRAAAERVVVPIARLRGRRCASAVPELDLGAPPPLFAAVDAGRCATIAVRRAGRRRRVRRGRCARSTSAGDRSSRASSRRPKRRSRPADRMVIVHTSGSTSEPKGVIHTHGALIRHLDNLNQLRRYTPDEVLFSNSPFFWIGGLRLRAARHAGRRRPTLVCSNAPDAAGVLDLLERERPTMVNGFAASRSPTCRTTRASPAATCPRSGAATSARSCRTTCGRRSRAAPHHARHDRGRQRVPGERRRVRPARAPARVVRPPRARASRRRVVDPDTRRGLRSGRAGRALAARPVPDGGLLRPRAPRGRSTPTGGTAPATSSSVDADGFFYFKGRRGDMIKTAGANVSPREVEAAIRDAHRPRSRTSSGSTTTRAVRSSRPRSRVPAGRRRRRRRAARRSSPRASPPTRCRGAFVLARRRRGPDDVERQARRRAPSRSCSGDALTRGRSPALLARAARERRRPTSRRSSATTARSPTPSSTTRAARWPAGWSRPGVGKGDRVGLLMPNGIDWADDRARGDARSAPSSSRSARCSGRPSCSRSSGSPAVTTSIAVRSLPRPLVPRRARRRSRRRSSIGSGSGARAIAALPALRRVWTSATSCRTRPRRRAWSTALEARRSAGRRHGRSCSPRAAAARRRA